jgi:hypothetical protein
MSKHIRSGMGAVRPYACRPPGLLDLVQRIPEDKPCRDRACGVPDAFGNGGWISTHRGDA